MKPRLLAISGPLTGTVREILGIQFDLGSAQANHLHLLDPTLSPRHCRIEQVGERYELVDLNSQSGTFLDAVPVRRKTIHHGETIRAGSSEFVFLLHEGEPVAASETPPDKISSPYSPAPPMFGAEVGRMARDLAALFRISNVVNSTRDSELLRQELLRLIFEVIPAEDGAVLLLTTHENEPFSICSWNRHSGAKGTTGIQREYVNRALWERTPVLIHASADSGEKQNILCLPLIAIERTIGVIYLTSLDAASDFREDHLFFLDSVSRIVAVALENILALDSLRSENLRLKQELNHSGKLVGDSPPIRQLNEFIARVAHSDSTVLIRGESGTGKEVVARSIHQSSPRNQHPFLAINCAAIPETLLETELFGHEKGAYTGAIGTKKGKFEAAEDGTVFLDEVGELPLPMQAKLLRVLQQREFERVGGTRPIPFQARVLAATNKNLEQAIKSGEFRQDLYYRLNVLSVTVPPLRSHREDIPLLALYFAALYAKKNKRAFKGISSKARSLLMNYSWPGNVRELENAIEHGIVLGLTEEILAEDLPDGILEEQSAGLAETQYHGALAQFKKTLLLNAIREAGGSYPGAARLLGIHPKYLHRLARNLNLKSDPI